jgi:putative endopeptidase
MPDREYYLKTDSKIAKLEGKYLEFLTKMLTLAGESNAAARAKAILTLKRRSRGRTGPRSRAAMRPRPTNKMTIAELQRRAPGFTSRLSRWGRRQERSADRLSTERFTGIAKAIQAHRCRC